MPQPVPEQICMHGKDRRMGQSLGGNKACWQRNSKTAYITCLKLNYPVTAKAFKNITFQNGSHFCYP